MRSVAFTAIRGHKASLLKAVRYKSYVKSDGFWWYRWHPDAWITIDPHWEKPLESYILRPGSCFVDVGCHLGRWAIRASRYYHRVLAFEPDLETNHAFRLNVSRNHLTNVLAFDCALSNSASEAFLRNFGNAACGSLRASHVSGAGERSSQVVRVKLLDDFIRYLSAPLRIKIDVEGSELAVLQGGAQTIDRFKPTLAIEVHFRKELPMIVEELRCHHYMISGNFSDRSDPRSQVYLIAEPPKVGR